MPIDFTDDAIEELGKIVEAEFGEPVTADQARVMARDLASLFDVLCRIAEDMPDAQRTAIGLRARSAR